MLGTGKLFEQKLFHKEQQQKAKRKKKEIVIIYNKEMTISDI